MVDLAPDLGVIGGREPAADVMVVAGDAAGWSGPAGPRRERRVDGLEFTVERGLDGDLLMRWGAEGTFHLSGATLRAAGRETARWRRVLLDSALGSAALSLGAEALHAGAVVIDGAAVAVTAGEGGGKSSVLAELVASDHALLADDVLVIESDLTAHPAPPVMNLALDRPPGAVGLGAVGDTLAEIDGEAWVAVRRVATAAPLRTLVVLDRRNAARAELVPLAPEPFQLVALLLDSGSAPERAAARLDRAAAIGAGVRLWRLVAPLDVAPAELATIVEEAARGA